MRQLPTPSLVRGVLRFNVIFSRAQNRLSQAGLAKQAGVSRTIISAIENATYNPSLDILEKLAAVLNTTVVELLSDHVSTGEKNDDIARRTSDGPEAYVDAENFIATLNDRAGRYSTRGRRKILSS